MSPRERREIWIRLEFRNPTGCKYMSVAPYHDLAS
jgi:hypothetical protein